MTLFEKIISALIFIAIAIIYFAAQNDRFKRK